jgi:hypothetical protein
MVYKSTAKILFFPVLSDIRKTITSKFLRLRPLVLQIRVLRDENEFAAMVEWYCGRKRKHLERNLYHCQFVLQKSGPGLHLDFCCGRLLGPSIAFGGFDVHVNCS